MDWYLIAKTTEETSWWLQPGSWLAILMMAAGLGVLIFVHELGHFVVAKLCGVKCEKFYLGFDIPIGKLLAALFKREKEVTLFGLPIPRTFVKFRWGETEYGIGVLPLGGYVKMLGQDDNPAAAARERERSRIKKEKPEGSEGSGAGDAQDATAEGEEEFVLDPRSYQAKNVPQRMAIISAGVIMNLLTAPIFATAAYMIGVDYTPCIVGEVVPAGAAYQAGMRHGDRILQIGGYDDPYENLRFDWDLRQGVAMVNEGDSLKVLARREVDRSKAENLEFLLHPRAYYIKKGEKMPGVSIGIVAPHTNEVYLPDAYEFSPAAHANPPLEKGDLIVGVRPVGETGEFQPVTDGYSLRKLLIRYSDRELELKLERKTGKQDAQGEEIRTSLVSKVEPNRFHDLGLIMKPGAIEAVYPDSPADKAGFKPGDRIKTVDGKPFGAGGIDPMLLSDALRPSIGKPVAVEVEREGKTVALEVTPEMPDAYDFVPVIRGVPMSCASLGIAYGVTLTVAAVRPDSPADKQGLEPGDKLTEVTFLPREGEKTSELYNKGEPIALDDKSMNWVWLYYALQIVPENEISLTYERAGKQQKPVTLETESSADFNPDRGIALNVVKETQYAGSLGEAAMLGLRETKENFVRVLIFLKKLATGGISPTNLGGPGTIAVVATSEASQGPSSLLLFLTFLSVNLAIVNFLPIPVLDGGHMMFLLYEALRGKPADERWQTTLTLIGFAFLLCLMVFVIGLDIVRFVPS